MSADRQQDAGLDRLVRAALREDSFPEGAVCPEADAIAAYVAGALSARERTELEPHLARCQRCQAVIAMIAADAAEEAARLHPASAPESPGSWFRRLRAAWLVPAGAAALAVAVYVATKPDATPSTPQTDSAQSVTGGSDRAIAKAADIAASPNEPAVGATEPARRTQASARSGASPRTVNELKAAAAEKPDTTLALAEQAPSPVPLAPAAAPPAPAGAAVNVAMAPPKGTREQALASGEALDAVGGDIEALWRRAEIVVVGRAESSVLRADKGRGAASRDAATIPTGIITVVESLKQPDGATLDRQLQVPAAPAAATRQGTAAEFVYFLTRVTGANGTTHLVTVGSVSLESRRDETLARLRQLAGAPRK